MRLKIIDDGGINYPRVVNLETGEQIEGVLSIDYSATKFGRVCTIRVIAESNIEMDFVMEFISRQDNANG